MRTLNLGILAHVDAGKTTLSERLLYTAGAIDHVGSVDAGTTQTDSLELERERGITIRSAVASFLVGDLAVNLVDTPGHPDFIAEVERVLGVLDGAVLVVSAVEGVQPQTPLLFRALQRLRVPTLIFVNKIDRAGADPDRVLDDDGAAARRPASCRWSASETPAGGRRPSRRSTADDAAPRSARGGPRRARRGDPAGLREGRGALTYPRLREQLGRADAQGRRPPGVLRLGRARDRRRRAAGRRRRAPVGRAAATRRRRSPAACSRSSAPPRASASRMRACSPARSGPRQRVRVGGGEEAKASSIKVFAPAGAPRRDVLTAGEMATIRGLGAVRVGDAIGDPPPGDEATARFPRPALEAVVFARKPEEQGSLRAALGQLAEQDPLIDVRQDDDAPRDRRLALRRGPEGGHPGDARARLRHRRRLPRDDHGVHRAPGQGRARPRRSSTRRRTPTSPAGARR